MDETRMLDSTAIGRAQPAQNYDQYAAADMKKFYPPGAPISNAPQNTEGSSLQLHFASLAGLDLGKRIGQPGERIDMYFKNPYNTESDEDEPPGAAGNGTHVPAVNATKAKQPRKRNGSGKRKQKSPKVESPAEIALRKFPCPECPLSFKTGYHLKRHHATIHQDQRFPCTVCHTSYGRREKLRAHLELIHKIQSYFVCEVCLVSYESDDLLQRHVYRHENPKPLECGTCLTPNARTSDGNYGGNHICITYQNNYECCGKDFGYHYYYNRHMLTVHNIKTNARVKLPKGTLLSQFRALRSSRVS
ncbi:PR domain zinc finger protein 10-like [Anopheles marshallii]|uniref:PR domain zinc finger protein 10-like n=1 Tax=Anopheles marshallii TaxID=1521116 RepID=UPI00237B24CA|nr:PR domain zinc finger protein 10-like [Anopheles marshallii]